MTRSAGRNGKSRMGKSVEGVSYGMCVKVIGGLLEVRPHGLLSRHKEPFLGRGD